MNTLHYFASTEAGGGDLFSSLGLDWQLFVLQMVAFVVLLGLEKVGLSTAARHARPARCEDSRWPQSS